jgi:Ca-activated chloride channel family protein
MVILDVSEAMRATDVSPTRLQSARRIVQNAIDRAPERLQMGGVAYGPAAYVVANPTYDHGAVSAALQAVRSVTGAAPGDALAVALAAIPASDAGPGKRVPGAIILISTGDQTGGRPLGLAVAAIEEAGIPVHTVAVGPRGAATSATPAPFNPDVLMQISRQTQGRAIANPTARDWDTLYQAIAEDVVVEPRPEEVGHLVGSAALATWTLGMVLLVTASRRLM